MEFKSLEGLDGNGVKIDVIAELHNRTAHHVLELIFQHFDAKSLRQAEMVSHVWKNAIYSLQIEKLWSGILHNQMKRCSIWKYLHDINKDSNIVGFEDTKKKNEIFSNRKLLSPNTFYSKLEFAVKGANENWKMTNGFTRENIILAKNMSGLTHLISSEIYFAFYNENWNEFHIFNREHLNKKLVFKVLDDLPYITNQSAYNYRIMEQFLVYPTTKCRFVFLDIMSGMHSVHYPLTESEDEQFVSFMTATKNVFAICVKTRKNHEEALDIYLWQFENVNFIDWKKYQKLHYNGSHDKRLTIDRQFSIIQSYQEGTCQIDVRPIDSLEKKVNLRDIKIGRTISFLFAEGLLFYEEDNTVKVVDLLTGVMWNIWKEDQSNNHIFSLVVTTDIFYAFSTETLQNYSECNDLNVALITLSSWKLIDLCNRKEMITREPNIRLKVCVPSFSKFFLNDVSIIFTWVDNRKIHFHKLSFLPICSYCKIIKHLIEICSLCESVRYCSSLCQKLDWNSLHVEHCKAFQKMKQIELQFGIRQEKNK